MEVSPRRRAAQSGVAGAIGERVLGGLQLGGKLALAGARVRRIFARAGQSGAEMDDLRLGRASGQ